MEGIILKTRCCVFTTLLIILMGCQNKEPSNKIFIDLSEGKPRQEKLDYELIESEIFQIEPSIPIGSLYYGSTYKDQFFFLEYSKNRARGICSFNNLGKLLWKYDRIGKGPGEFDNCLFYRVLPISKEIVLYDLNQSKLLFISLNGKFLREIEVKFWLGDLCELDENLILFNIQKSEPRNANPEGYRYDLGIMTKEGIVTKLFLPHKHTILGWASLGSNLLPRDSEIVYVNSLNYNIYQVTNNGASPKWSLDFGRYNADTAKLLYTTNKQETFTSQMISGDDKTVYCFSLIHTRSSIWVSVDFNKKVIISVVDKTTNKVRQYESGHDNYFRMMGIPLRGFFQSTNSYIAAIDAFDASEDWKQRSTTERENTDPRWRAIMESLEPTDNPIVLIANLR